MDKTLILKILSVVVLLFFLFQIIGPAVGKIIDSENLQTQSYHVTDNATILSLSSLMVFFPSSADYEGYENILKDFEDDKIITYFEKQNIRTKYYEINILLENNSIIDDLGRYGVLMRYANVKPFTEKVYLNILVSPYRNINDTLPVEFDISKKGDMVLNIANARVAQIILNLSQDTVVKTTDTVLIEVYLPSEDDEFIDYMHKNYNVDVNYLALNDQFRFKTAITNVTSPRTFYDEVSSFVSKKNGTLSFTETITVTLDSEVGPILLNLEVTQGYDPGDDIHVNAEIIAMENSIIAVNNFDVS